MALVSESSNTTSIGAARYTYTTLTASAACSSRLDALQGHVKFSQAMTDSPDSHASISTCVPYTDPSVLAIPPLAHAHAFSVRLPTVSVSRTTAGHVPHLRSANAVQLLDSQSHFVQGKALPPVQYELFGQASQTRSVVFVHEITSCVPAAHAGLQSRLKSPPVQNEFPGHLEQIRSVTFVHAVVSYVPAWHAGVQFLCSPRRQYDSLAHAEHARSAARVHGVTLYVPGRHAEVQGIAEVPPAQNELFRQTEQTRSVRFVQAVVSYIPASHAGEQRLSTPSRQYDSSAGHSEHTISEEAVHSEVT